MPKCTSRLHKESQQNKEKIKCLTKDVSHTRADPDTRDLSGVRRNKMPTTKCRRCKSRGESNPPNYKYHQQNKDVVALICPKCGYVGGHIENNKRR